jgi:hypothetical protein
MNFGIIKKGGTKWDSATIAVHNRETVDIAIGTPIVFVMEGTSDGCDIQLPSSSSANKASAFPAGIAIATIKASSSGNNSIVYGIATNALVSATITRSASSAVWASAIGIAVGDILTINTLANVLEFLSAGSAAKAANWQFNAVGTIASITTAASGSAGTYPLVNGLGGASTDTIAYITSLIKVFVRTL